MNVVVRAVADVEVDGSPSVAPGASAPLAAK